MYEVAGESIIEKSKRQPVKVTIEDTITAKGKNPFDKNEKHQFSKDVASTEIFKDQMFTTQQSS